MTLWSEDIFDNNFYTLKFIEVSFVPQYVVNPREYSMCTWKKCICWVFLDIMSWKYPWSQTFQFCSFKISLVLLVFLSKGFFHWCEWDIKLSHYHCTPNQCVLVVVVCIWCFYIRGIYVDDCNSLFLLIHLSLMFFFIFLMHLF